ncbi:hypothetical protein [Streptosporangium saharense]|uniref:Guanylate cyclase domain-containing protein n=1 Tax=Streptosporangium saharense TaxID=1706840 RepID=A0A7W7VSL1_9ACTN|nr:hypothetical protein [Streptosporangium saharense]MBB4920729.1 hypothetical protein [Streptosporangium saharense]
MTEAVMPEYRAMISGDIEDYSSRNAGEQAVLQTALANLLDTAAREAGIERPRWSRQVSGDGEFSVLTEPASVLDLADSFVRELDVALAVYNRRQYGDNWTRVRLRVALHVGPVLPATPMGRPGPHAVQVNRLVDAPAAREAMRVCPAADLAVIVSDRVFDDYLSQGYGHPRPVRFRPVTVQGKKQRFLAYLYLPNADVHELRELDVFDPPADETSPIQKDGDGPRPPKPFGAARDVIMGDQNRVKNGNVYTSRGDMHFGTGHGGR